MREPMKQRLTTHLRPVPASLSAQVDTLRRKTAAKRSFSFWPMSAFGGLKRKSLSALASAVSVGEFQTNCYISIGYFSLVEMGN